LTRIKLPQPEETLQARERQPSADGSHGAPARKLATTGHTRKFSLTGLENTYLYSIHTLFASAQIMRAVKPSTIEVRTATHIITPEGETKD